MSSGPGRIERAILCMLALAPGQRLSRRQLEESLCDHQGHHRSAVLRSIRTLKRDHCVSFADYADKDRATVELLRPELVSDERVFGLLHEFNLGRLQEPEGVQTTYSKPGHRHEREPRVVGRE